mmetsp:Transcript_114931/g.202860  ORF Transcript_114931/g.202860 Transcript_114931/m.202860 type:complete len:201 (+) Transcript_114931:1826-2428(+)
MPGHQSQSRHHLKRLNHRLSLRKGHQRRLHCGQDKIQLRRLLNLRKGNRNGVHLQVRGRSMPQPPQMLRNQMMLQQQSVQSIVRGGSGRQVRVSPQTKVVLPRSPRPRSRRRPLTVKSQRSRQSSACLPRLPMQWTLLGEPVVPSTQILDVTSWVSLAKIHQKIKVELLQARWTSGWRRCSVAISPAQPQLRQLLRSHSH